LSAEKSGRGRKWRMFLRRERGDTRSILSFLFLFYRKGCHH
jgi:hypothetical protein